jgi:hypothetical protein
VSNDFLRDLIQDNAEHDVLADMAFDESLRSKLHSTNPLARVNTEIKRRTNVVGFVGKTAPHAVFFSSSLPNRETDVRPVGALMLEQNDEWASGAFAAVRRTARRSPPPRRYMPVEKLTAVCNDTDAATMIAAQGTRDTSYDEAGGRQFLHHFAGHCLVFEQTTTGQGTTSSS